MKAMTYSRYGGPEVLGMEEVERPIAGEGQILVRVHAASVSTADWRMRAAAYPGALWLPGRLMTGLLRPKKKILGTDFAGVVEAVGPGVTRFAKGDRVFGFSGWGAHAEFLAVSEEGPVASIPDGLTFEEAAALPFGGLSALVFLRDVAQVKAGQRVLILGASGGVGAYAVQIAAALGAEVTGLASGANRDEVLALGAIRFIDYKAEDFHAGSTRYDVILDTVGATDFRRAKASLTSKGLFVPLNFGLTEALQALRTAWSKGRRVLVATSGDTREDLETLAEMVASGRVRPVVDSVFPLEEAADAHRRVEGRHKRGAVILRIGAQAPLRAVA